MNYHAHLTVFGADEYTPHGWKKTDIILEKDNRTQIDTMLTKHYQLGKKGIHTIQDIIEDAPTSNQLKVTRLKIEQDSDFFLPVTKETYLEIHMLCEGEKKPKGEWVRSRNPKSLSPEGVPRYFFNMRLYEGNGRGVKSLANLIQVDLFEQGFDYLEFKVEQVVFDSNREMDSWWA